MSSDLITLAREKLAKQEYAGLTNDYTDGRDFENARTKPITDALLKVAEAGVAIAKIDFDLIALNDNAEGVLRTCVKVSKDALAELEKAVKGER